MRKISLKTWKENGKDATIINALNALIASQDPRELPKGIDQFRTFNRIGKAFEKAEKSKVWLELDEGDYLFLKGMVEKKIPSTWGMIGGLSDAMEEFMNAKKVEEEKSKE